MTKKTPRNPRVWVWTSVNVVLATVAVFGLWSDIWEALITLFLASTLMQLLWMRRNAH